MNSVENCPFCNRDYVQVDLHLTSQNKRMLSFFCHDCKKSANYPSPSLDLDTENDLWNAKKSRSGNRISDLKASEIAGLNPEWSSKRGDGRLPPKNAN